MMRFFRQIMGKGRREAEADEVLKAHRIEHESEMRKLKNRNRALKQLVDGLQKDITAWR